MVHRRRTEQDEAIEGDDQEEGVQHGSAKPEKEEEGERYGPGAGDKLFIEYSTNPGFWEPGKSPLESSSSEAIEISCLCRLEVSRNC